MPSVPCQVVISGVTPFVSLESQIMQLPYLYINEIYVHRQNIFKYILIVTYSYIDQLSAALCGI